MTVATTPRNDIATSNKRKGIRALGQPDTRAVGNKADNGWNDLGASTLAGESHCRRPSAQYLGHMRKTKKAARPKPQGYATHVCRAGTAAMSIKQPVPHALSLRCTGWTYGTP